jgi:malonyl CoA-acyl carrier protein transacylase
MGADLFDQVGEFRAAESEIDTVLGYSLRGLCLTDSENKLKQTEYTQPALFIVNALHYYNLNDGDRRPSFVVGHSLGEYNALLAAGAFDLVTGLRLVQKRGELMAKARLGGMSAVIGIEPERIRGVLQEAGLTTIDVANYNSPTQTVISGPVESLKLVRPTLEKAGARIVIPLEVSAAFHSRYMKEAQTEFADFIGTVRFSPLRLAVISNVTAQPYPMCSTSATIRALLVRQITSSVLWTQTVRYLLRAGVTRFKECGPGNRLTQLIQSCRQSVLS